MRYSDYKAFPEAANSQHDEAQSARSRDCTAMIMRAMARYLRNESEEMQMFALPAKEHKYAA